MSTADIGVFGGSGFYAFLDDVETIELDTPFGAPSSPVTIGTVAGRRVAFLPRHGRRHELAPHAIPYRANVWAMKELGVGALLAPGAVGSLQPHVHPGDFVVVDQLVDRTWGRADTFHTDFAGGRGPRLVRPALRRRRCGGCCSMPAGPRGSRCTTAAPWWSSRGRASPPQPSRAGSVTWAGRW